MWWLVRIPIVVRAIAGIGIGSALLSFPVQGKSHQDSLR